MYVLRSLVRSLFIDWFRVVGLSLVIYGVLSLVRWLFISVVISSFL